MSIKIIPLLKCSDMQEAIQFYTGILDFELLDADASSRDPVIDLVKDEAVLQLTIFESDRLYGSVINILVDDVDALFKKYLQRGLDTTGKKDSPVHQGPLDQSWGIREFYVTDTDGNTLRFGHPFHKPKARYINAWPYQEGRRMDLPVKDASAAASFYTDIMNFREVSRTSMPVPAIIFERDSIQIAIAENGGDPGQEGCFFEVDNVETALRELELNGLKKEISTIKTEKNGETHWKVFYVIAPDGLCYCIGEKESVNV